MLNKALIIISIIVILIFSYLQYKSYKTNLTDIRFHRLAIQNNFVSKGNIINDEYIGYIEIKKIGVKRLIKSGITKKVLDDNFVGFVNSSNNLDEKTGNSILAGHNISIVFSKLRLLQYNDEIIINTYKSNYRYKVVSKKEISIVDKNNFPKSNSDKILTLLTCTNDYEKRLVIIAKKV